MIKRKLEWARKISRNHLDNINVNKIVYLLYCYKNEGYFDRNVIDKFFFSYSTSFLRARFRVAYLNAILHWYIPFRILPIDLWNSLNENDSNVYFFVQRQALLTLSFVANQLSFFSCWTLAVISGFYVWFYIILVI